MSLVIVNLVDCDLEQDRDLKCAVDSLRVRTGEVHQFLVYSPEIGTAESSYPRHDLAESFLYGFKAAALYVADMVDDGDHKKKEIAAFLNYMVAAE